MKKILTIYVLFLVISSCATKKARPTNEEYIYSRPAYDLYKKAHETGGKEGVKLLETADSLEPYNSLILEKMALLRFNEKDVDGAFRDISNSIRYSKDPRLLHNRYFNRGLFYLKIGDISKACDDMHLSGKWGEENIARYCNDNFDTTIYQNSDNKFELKLKLKKAETSISSAHSPATMTECLGRLVITNNSDSLLTLINTAHDYGLESGGNSFYLEAINAEGIKVRFFSTSQYLPFGSDKDKNILKGTSFTKEVNITHLHQFCYPGIYQVRVVMRPTAKTVGLTKTYYSNWVNLTVTGKQ